uniref:helix-turn-helix transcriptional regulator n=1 Tax=Ralstonia pseudosolanacearum TaxID=1310165 RepID=UPI001E2C2ABF
GLLQEPDDLRFRKPLLHVRLPLRKRTLLASQWTGLLGAGHREQVKIVLKRSLASGRPELPDVARELGMSERTLQRRITDDGGSFRGILIEARQELGRQLLADPSADIEEVACLLGYQDTSSFYRAFRGWEGVTPNRWRELNSNGPAV